MTSKPTAEAVCARCHLPLEHRRHKLHSSGRPVRYGDGHPFESHGKPREEPAADVVATARDAVIDSVRPYRDGVEGVAQALAHETALAALIALTEAPRIAELEAALLSVSVCSGDHCLGCRETLARVLAPSAQEGGE